MFSLAEILPEAFRNPVRAGRAALALAALAGLAAAPFAVAQEQPRPVEVLATVGMIADVAENVGGACVEVTQLMGPGVDPHLYQASAGDVRRFQEADLILYAGYALEGQLGDVLERFGERTPTIAVGPASIDPAALITTQDVYGIDPHLWMDPSLWARTAPTIAEAIGAIAPSCAATVRANAEAYVAQLEALHAWAGEALATIPAAQRILVTAHDAFEYYGRAYGLEVAGIQGISTESEAGVADIREMAALVAERRVPAVFVETTINPRTIQAVIDAAAERGHEVRIGAELYSDAMGEPGTAGGSYVGMIYQNTVAIARELGGAVPPLPEALRPWAERWGVPPEGDA
jgi:manganese/zinc/iron transport system substrate-binding protein